MSDILSRLKQLGVTKGIPENFKPPVKKPSEQMDVLLRTFSNGLVVENDLGYTFINRLRQPLAQPHGIVSMQQELTPSPLFDSIMEMSVADKKDTLAFDTETSGLSNGSGSFIFMLGLGYFEANEYIVDQLILPDLNAEKAFLRQAELIFSRYPVLLSYNGKSFDIPMLQNRLRFHMLPDFTKNILHCDLLKLTRRYWKEALGTVPLSGIERYVLELQRGDEEVPGYLAPELYRSYLSDNDAEHIAGVAYHNQIDVVSLSAFLIYLNDLVIKAENEPKFWKENKVSESALMRYNLPFFCGKVISELDRFSLKDKKAMASKLMKTGSPEKALEILKELAAKGEYEASERLMYYYRKTKAPQPFEHYRALSIELLEKDPTIGKWTKEEKLNKIKNLK